MNYRDDSIGQNFVEIHSDILLRNRNRPKMDFFFLFGSTSSPPCGAMKYVNTGMKYGTLGTQYHSKIAESSEFPPPLPDDCRSFPAFLRSRTVDNIFYRSLREEGSRFVLVGSDRSF